MISLNTLLLIGKSHFFCVDRQAAKHLRPYRRQLEALQTIPGIGAATAAVVIAELGVDPTTFPTVGQLVAWSGLCPGNNESAGRNLGARLRKGNPHLRTALVEATMGAIRKRDSYLRAKYYRLKARRGGKRAAIAVAHKLVIAIHNVMFQGRTYVDLGADYLDRQASERTRRGLVRRLERMGFHVELAPKQHPDGAELSGESTALAQA